MTSPSRFDYEGMQAIAQRLAQRSADLFLGLGLTGCRAGS